MRAANPAFTKLFSAKKPQKTISNSQNKKMPPPQTGAKAYSVRGTTLFTWSPLRLLLDTSVGFVVNGSTYPWYASPFPSCLPWPQSKSKPGIHLASKHPLRGRTASAIQFTEAAPRRVHHPCLPVHTTHRLSGKPETITTPHHSLCFFFNLRKISSQMSSCFIFKSFFLILSNNRQAAAETIPKQNKKQCCHKAGNHLSSPGHTIDTAGRACP
jgi:hypothetical protein